MSFASSHSSFLSDHPRSTPDMYSNVHDLFDEVESGPQNTITHSRFPSSPSASQTAAPGSLPTLCPSWLDPSLFNDDIHTRHRLVLLHDASPTDNTSNNSLSHAGSFSVENPNASKDASVHSDSHGQPYHDLTNLPGACGSINPNNTHNTPARYHTQLTPPDPSQTNYALDTRQHTNCNAFFNNQLTSTIPLTQYNESVSSATHCAPSAHNTIDPNTFLPLPYDNAGLHLYTSTFPPDLGLPSHWGNSPAIHRNMSLPSGQAFSSPNLMASNDAFVATAIETQPQFTVDQNVGNYYATYTNTHANNAANWGIDCSQHSQPPSRISTTEHTASAAMPNTMTPSTSEVSSVEFVVQQKNPPTSLRHVPWGLHHNLEPLNRLFPASASSHPPSQTDPFPISSNEISRAPTPSTTRKPNSMSVRSLPNPMVPESSPPYTPPQQTAHSEPEMTPVGTKQEQKHKRGKQLVPDKKLWTRTRDGQYACRYNGPAASTGCKSVLSTLRNLGRHMREIHAVKETKMDIPDDERIAVNGLPAGLRLVQISCPYRDKDLHKCRYYRENGRRWHDKTMSRKDKLLRRHALHYH